MVSTNEMIVTSRKPTHPGEMLHDEFMPEFNLSVAQLAKQLHTSRQTVNELAHSRRAASPDMCIRLGRLFGTTPHYWMNLQRNVDLWDATKANPSIQEIEPIAREG